MERSWSRLLLVGIVLFVAAFVGSLSSAYAQSASSTNYMVDQTQFGSGSSIQSCSEEFCSQSSLGDTATGSASSNNYSAQFGAVTAGEPVLEIITIGGLQDLGVLDVDHVATATAEVKVRNYFSSGYVMQIIGHTPGQGVHELKALDQASTSHPGMEQFGINIVANSDPSVGTDPVQVPDNETSFGQVMDDYSTPNLFKYVSGEPVAFSNSSTGQTNYTISMIINVSNITPGGKYRGDFAAVVIPTY
jgi:hypothetical protein